MLGLATSGGESSPLSSIMAIWLVLVTGLLVSLGRPDLFVTGATLCYNRLGRPIGRRSEKKVAEACEPFTVPAPRP